MNEGEQIHESVRKAQILEGRRRVGDIGIPPRYLADKREECCRHEGWAKVYQQLASVLAVRADGYLILLCGGRGTGKTRMGCELMREATTQWGFQCRYLVMEDYLQTVRRPDVDRDQVHDLWFSPRILVVDEIGKSGESAWMENKLFHLVNTRHNDLKHTVLICAASPQEAAEVMGPSLTDRINNGGRIAYLNWPSFRSNQQQT